MDERIKKYISDTREILKCVASIEELSQIIKTLEGTYSKDRRVYVFGNGGSASTSSHFVSDLNKQCSIRAFCLNDNIPLVTAWANDTAYWRIFSRQLSNLIEEKDVVIGISGSGNSDNILSGISIAKGKGAITIGLTGFDGGKLKELADIAVVVPSHSMEKVEDIHLIICHTIITCLRGKS